jgi:hypothetical protein
VEKIKDSVFFNLQFFPCTPKGFDRSTLPKIYSDEHDDSGGE